MYYCSKALLTALMLVFAFSTNSFAAVDCRGLSKVVEYEGEGARFSSLHGRCLNFQFRYGNTDLDFEDPITGTVIRSIENKRSSSSSQKEEGPEKMSMAEIRAHKFDPSLDTTRTKKKDLIAKTLIERYDLWNIFRLAGGTGVRYIIKKNGLGGHSETNYRPHSGNIFIYMFKNFSAMEVARKLKISSKDFVEMNIEVADVFSGKVSSEKVFVHYGTMLKNRRVTDGVSVESILSKF